MLQAPLITCCDIQSFALSAPLVQKKAETQNTCWLAKLKRPNIFFNFYFQNSKMFNGTFMIEIVYIVYILIACFLVVVCLICLTCWLVFAHMQQNLYNLSPPSSSYGVDVSFQKTFKMLRQVLFSQTAVSSSSASRPSLLLE